MRAELQIVLSGSCPLLTANVSARWQVISHSQSTRKAIGGNLVEHFKFLLVMGPTELKKEIKARFDAWDEDKSGQLNKNEMMVRKDTRQPAWAREIAQS